ncbi:MAG: enoyl-CoA hydratase/isomerase family protein [Betaproteobacteria bacterium]|nr:enoyl-CoA hydratase/isomerase family protein [Betaproteobacteria bacterium]
MIEHANGELLVDIRNHIAHLTLNRPKALNALTHGMIQSMTELLDGWATDDNIKAIIVRGAGEKAFCAGGDIRSLYDTARRADGSELDFFREEYELDFTIHRYLIRTGKPYIAWLDGIVMGGGMGISMGGVLRIVGGRTRMAMPETVIGMFPDVGGSYFLSRCPGAIGLYLGLTGQVIKAADALYTGLATHHIASESAFEFDYALDSLVDWSAGPIVAMRDIVQKFARAPIEAGTLPGLSSTIEKHFAGKPDVAAIVTSLESETDANRLEWASATAAALAKKSPTLLEVTKQQIERAARMNLAECFRMELNLVTATFEHGDIAEGIRALMIDKDQSPAWKPPKLADVSPASVNEFFRSRWDNDSHPLKHLQIVQPT